VGYCGGQTLPSSNIAEREIIFGGEERLKRQIETTLEVLDGDLYIVATACQTDIIGDDAPSIVAGFQDQGDFVFVEAGGFKGDSYQGYARLMEALFKRYIPAKAPQKKRVNLLGLVPGFDPFFRADLEELKRLLTNLGLEVTAFLTGDEDLSHIQKAGSTELNIVFSPTHGLTLGQSLQEKYDLAFEFQELPIGEKATAAFLTAIAERTQVPKSQLKAVLKKESERYYQYVDRIADVWADGDFQCHAVVVGNATSTGPLTYFLDQEIGWLVDLAYITDQVTEEEEESLRNLFDRRDYAYQPQLHFETSTNAIQTHLLKSQPQFLAGDYLEKLDPLFVLGSTLEAKLAETLGGNLLAVSYPILNRAVLTAGYAGYNGGLRLWEDLTGAQVAKRL
jgi:nitrogenase molybdenum-iron protein beta chain